MFSAPHNLTSLVLGEKPVPALPEGSKAPCSLTSDSFFEIQSNEPTGYLLLLASLAIRLAIRHKS